MSMDVLIIQHTMEVARGPDLLLFMSDARLGATFDLAETIKWQQKMEKSRWNDLLASQEFQQR